MVFPPKFVAPRFMPTKLATPESEEAESFLLSDKIVSENILGEISATATPSNVKEKIL